MTSWKTTKLDGKIHVKHGFPFKSEYFEEVGDYVVLTPGNFFEEGGFKRNAEKDKCYSHTFPSEYLLEQGDLLVAMTEQAEGLLGSTAKIPQNDKFLHNQRLGLITSTDEEIDLDYIYHLFKTKSVREQIRLTSSGSKVKHTSPDRIYDVQVLIPDSKATQKKIAKVLSTLDAKIELNNRINAELEAMAKLLYDYWFVQFDFPMTATQATALGKPELEGHPYKASGGPMTYNKTLKREIPEGWEVHELGNLISFNRGISYKSSDIGSHGIPMINLNSFHLDGRYKHDGTKFYGGKYKTDKIVYPEDLIIAITDVTRNADIIAKAFLIPNHFDDDILISCDIAKVNCSTSITKEWLVMLFNSEHYHNYIKWFASGTLVLHLDLNGVSWYKTEVPPLEISSQFSRIYRLVHSKIQNHQKQNQELTALRDWLLPMLMNGQVTVK